jgi:hypothetical protein
MLTLFKPNAKNTGAAVSISFNSKDEKKGVFLEFLKQVGWDDSRKKGSFKGGLKITCKLNTTEVGQILYALENNKPFEKPLYHNSPSGGATLINVSSFKEYLTLSIKKGDDKAGIALTAGEQVEIREYLKFALSHIFSGLYSEQIKRNKEYKERQDGGSGEPYAKPKAKSVKDFVEEESPKEVVAEIEDDEIPF